MYCDLHGHSRSSNIFIYGCDEFPLGHPDRFKSRLLPYLLSQVQRWQPGNRSRLIQFVCVQACENFSFRDCTFSVARGKESTARVVSYRQLNIANAYTLEAR